MQPVHGVPVMPFPCAAFVMQRQIEQRQDCFVDFVLVVVHISPHEMVTPEMNGHKPKSLNHKGHPFDFSFRKLRVAQGRLRNTEEDLWNLPTEERAPAFVSPTLCSARKPAQTPRELACSTKDGAPRSLIGLSISGRRAWLHIDNHVGVLGGDFEAGAELAALGKLNGGGERQEAHHGGAETRRRPTRSSSSLIMARAERKHESCHKKKK